MTSKTRICFPALLMFMAVLGLTGFQVTAQAPAAAGSRFLGTVTAINGTTLTVKTDAGEVHQVDVPATAILKQVEPGAKDLNAAQTIQFNTIATGDRVLVRLDPNAPAGSSVALQIIAVKQADLAKKQEREREDWAQHGVGGLVKSVDAGSGTIVITSGVGPAAKTLNIHTDKNTVLKRYAPASVRYDLAKPETINAIHAGDQLRARGQKDAAGTEVAAQEVVSGTFRNISGTINSIDTTSSTLQVKDLATKKQVTIKVTPDSQMRKLPENMSRMLASILNGSGPAGRGGPGGGGPGGPGTGQGAAGAPSGGGNAGPGGQGGPGGHRVGIAGGGGFDAQMMLSRAPQVKLDDLKKGDAIMVVATDDSSGMSAITLMAGVEPLLEAPAASQNLLNWSLSTGAPDAGQ
jgi:ribosome maturation factor RimP